MISNQKIAIFGFGKEGVSSANYLGRNNQLTIIDEKTRDQIDPIFFEKLKAKKVKFYLGGGLPAEKFDLVVRTPGARPNNPIVTKLIKSGAVQTSVIKIFFELCPCPIIGITGTKGKGTAATLIYEMLKTQNQNVFLGGNIGTSPLDFLNDLTAESLVVLELSSFQLMNLAMSPHIAVVLMITSEHLDWHKDTTEYQKAKESIVKYQAPNDFAIINQDFSASLSFAHKTKAKVLFVSTTKKTNGVYLESNKIISQIKKSEQIIDISEILLPGKHNLQNVIAATAVAKINGIPNDQIIRVLTSFKGLIHRLQLVTEVGGVKFYNDSFSTIPETTIAAIEAFSNPKILILGGSSKNSDFANLAEKIHQDRSLGALILIGLEGPRIRQAIENAGGFEGRIIEGLKNMQQIVSYASQIAKNGDVVILSPACASFDMFKNYQDRGEQFIQQVNLIKMWG